MKVLFDHQIFTFQRYGGISRYFTEIIDKFLNNQEVEAELSLKYTICEYLRNSNIPNNNYTFYKKKVKSFEEFLPILNFKGKNKLFNILKKIGFLKVKEKDIEKYNIENSLKKIKKNKFDLFHPTYYDAYFLNYLKNKPYVLTVYDMIHEIFAEKIPFYNNTIIQKKKSLIEKASGIIAISENTKKDIIDIYNINKNKINVIHLGSSFNNLLSLNVDLKLPDKYLLFVGDRWFYKNFTFLVKSIASLLKKNKDLYLVCAGSNNFTDEELKLFKSLNINDNIIHVKIINNDELAFCYNKALAFIFPSLYEGFGIPILEAFSCGCPTLLSNRSCFPEIAEDAAFYFDPEDENSIADSIERLMIDTKLRKDLIDKGSNRLKNFSWEKTAQETLKVYKKLL